MICYIFSDDEPRRPGQRLPTSMLGNEVITNDIIMMIRMIMTMIMMMIMIPKVADHPLNCMKVDETGTLICVGAADG